MRADARRNRDRLLDAAIEIILEVGPEPPLGTIARRADVGIGTLYRHFRDRAQLLDAVAEHALERSIDAAETALAADRDGHHALRRYLHDAVDIGVGVLNIVHPLLDADWREQRARMTALLTTMLEQGKQAGRLRDDLRLVDVVFPAIRFSRPLAIGLPPADERALAHRHLDIYIDGLGTGGPQPPTATPIRDRWST
jgi:AcrR family transcriptional regulator